jgi:hypothetical protein
VNVAEFADACPELYHVSELGSWPSIRRHGLLSPARLLDVFQASDEQRSAVLASRRLRSVPLTHPDGAVATIRDQLPLLPGRLANCLTDMSLDEWLSLLNDRVFLWPTHERRDRLLTAKEYAGRAHDVVVIDSARLVARHAARIQLSAINSGATRPFAHSRGSRTFLPLVDFPYADRRRRVGRGAAIAEVAVCDAIPDVEELTLRVERREAGRLLKVIWARSPDAAAA